MKNIFYILLISLFIHGCEETNTQEEKAHIGTILVNNETSENLYQVYIGDSKTYGEDYLSGSQYIKAGTQVEFKTSQCNQEVYIKVATFLSDTTWTFKGNLDCGKKLRVTTTTS